MITLSTNIYEFYNELEKAGACQEALDWVKSFDQTLTVYDVIKAWYKTKNLPKNWVRFIITKVDLDEQVARMMAAVVRDEPAVLYTSAKKQGVQDTKWWKYFIIDKGRLVAAKGRL